MAGTVKTILPGQVQVSGPVGIGTTPPAGLAGMTGAVNDKGGQVHNVLAYGLKNDGVTDNSAAWTALLAALPQASFKNRGAAPVTAPYATLYFPPGTYTSSTPWTIPAGARITIQGAGRAYQELAQGPAAGVKTGGTIIASTSANGVFVVSYTAVLGDASIVIVRDLDFRADCPAPGLTSAAVDLGGAYSGGLENVGIQFDPQVVAGLSTQPAGGLVADNGSVGNTLWLRHVDVNGFGSASTYTMWIGGNHIEADDIHINANKVGCNGLWITPLGNRQSLGSFHFFQIGDGTNPVQLVYLQRTMDDSLGYRQTAHFRSIAVEDIDPGTGQTSGFFGRASVNEVLLIDRFLNDSGGPTTDQIIDAAVRTWVTALESNGTTALRGTYPNVSLPPNAALVGGLAAPDSASVKWTAPASTSAYGAFGHRTVLTLTNASVASLALDGNATPIGFLFVQTSSLRQGVLAVNGPLHNTKEIFTDGGKITATKDTASALNIYWDTDGYYVQNLLGETVNVVVFYMLQL